MAELPTMCEHCGDLMETTIEDYTYEDLGVSVILENAEIATCETCGYFEVAIEDPTRITSEIAATLLAMPGPLSFEVVRYICDAACARLEGFHYPKEGKA